MHHRQFARRQVDAGDGRDIADMRHQHRGLVAAGMFFMNLRADPGSAHLAEVHEENLVERPQLSTAPSSVQLAGLQRAAILARHDANILDAVFAEFGAEAAGLRASFVVEIALDRAILEIDAVGLGPVARRIGNGAAARCGRASSSAPSRRRRAALAGGAASSKPLASSAERATARPRTAHLVPL